jgi:hypothetical protein
MCEFCGQDPCQCDRDDNNPVDLSEDALDRLYSNPDYDMDHDHSMDG